jgi:murein DD-endopeptidase MepM/ murein hydrolase activator NlpD
MSFLFNPLNKMQINQRYNQNSTCVSLDGSNKVIGCDGNNPPDGYKSIYKKGHGALDLHAKRGDVIYSSQDGWVEEYVAEDRRGLGLGIITDRKHYCNETDSEEHFKIRYWHQYVNLVKKGDKVKIGQPIALADTTGYSSGDHLHYEVKPVKVSKTGKITNILQDNGYYGAVNPESYLNGFKASDYTKHTTWVQRLVFVLLKYLVTPSK